MNSKQGLGGNSTQHLMIGCAGNRPPPATSTSDVVAPLEDSSSYKVGKLSAAERKEKIHRYLKKRNQRNFTKKIKVKGEIKKTHLYSSETMIRADNKLMKWNRAAVRVPENLGRQPATSPRKIR